MKRNKTPTYHDDLMARLKDPRHAEGYLNAALEDDDKRVFLLALRDIADAHGGMTELSRLTKISREHIYRMLSEKGNPEFITIKTLLNAIGLKFAVETKKKEKKAA